MLCSCSPVILALPELHLQRLENCTLRMGSTSNPCSCSGNTAHLFPTYPETTCDWIVRQRPVDEAIAVGAGATDAELTAERAARSGRLARPRVAGDERPKTRRARIERRDGRPTARCRLTDAGTVAVAEVWLRCSGLPRGVERRPQTKSDMSCRNPV